MRINGKQRWGISIFVALIALFIALTIIPVVMADGETRLATPKEKEFYKTVLNTLVKTVPAGPDGWDLTREKIIEELKYVAPGVEDCPFEVEYYIGWQDTQKIQESKDITLKALSEQMTESTESTQEMDKSWEEFEKLATELEEALNKGDMTKVQEIQAKMEVIGEKIRDAGSAQKQASDEIIRELAPKDVKLNVRITVNSLWAPFAEPGQEIPLIAGGKAFRTEERFKNERWENSVTYIFFGENWEFIDDGYAGYMEATPLPGIPSTEVQTIILAVQGEETRVNDYVKKVDWTTLKSLLKK